MKQLPELPRFVRARDVRRALANIDHDTLNRLIADGVLPEPIRPTKHLILFEHGALMQAFRRMGAAA